SAVRNADEAPFQINIGDGPVHYLRTAERSTQWTADMSRLQTASRNFGQHGRKEQRVGVADEREGHRTVGPRKYAPTVQPSSRLRPRRPKSRCASVRHWALVVAQARPRTTGQPNRSTPARIILQTRRRGPTPPILGVARASPPPSHCGMRPPSTGKTITL